MPVTIGPCDWDIPDPTCCAKWTDELPDEEKAKAKRWAAWLLWTATGRQLGRCVTTLRPCRKSCRDDDWPPRPDGRMVGYGRWVAAITDPARAAWAGALCGCGQHTCTCGRLCQIHLPGVDPVPDEILIDGQVVPLAGFRVDNGHWLVFPKNGVTLPDGTTRTCFPSCQDLAAPTTEDGTWAITYTHGLPVPLEGLDAAAELACEIAKACGGAGPSECVLPSNVVSMTRNGVSYEFAGNNGSVTTSSTSRILRFNIPIVDMWVQSINPYGVTDRVQAWSPDLPSPGRIQTWP